MQKNIRILLRIICFPAANLIHFFSYIIPKKNNIWVFGAWLGERFADNPKYFYEYLLTNHKNIKAIWITKNKLVLNELKKAGNQVYHTTSPMAWWFAARAKVAIYCHHPIDIIRFLITSKQIKFMMPHGLPYKKSYYANSFTTYYHFSKAKNRFIRYWFHFYQPKDSFVLASSPMVSQLHESTFDLPPEHQVLLGFPRHDILYFANTDKKSTRCLKILYAPTWRDYLNCQSVATLFANESELIKINFYLEKQNAILYIRPHYKEKNNYNKKLKEYSHIKLDPIEDAQESLLNTDILIVDYSSYALDFLILNRPIIYLPLDLEQYLRQDHEFYYDYDEFAVGEQFFSWQEITDKFFSNIADYSDRWSESRQKLFHKMHQYHDGKSSERVYQFLLKHLTKEK